MVIYFGVLETDRDRDRVEQYYLSYGTKIYRLAQKIMGNSDDGWDIAQTVFERISLYPETFFRAEAKYPKTFGGYLMTTAYHLCMTELKKRHIEQKQTVYDANLDALPDPNELDTSSIATLQIREAIRKLHDADQELMYLNVEFGASFPEIAAAQHEKESTLKSRLKRAKMRLAQRLMEENHDAESK